MEQIIFITQHSRTARDQAQPAWLCERQVLLDQLDLLLRKVTSLVDEGKAVDVVYLDFSKALNTFSQHSPGEARSLWLGQVHCLLAKKLAGWLGLESGGD